MKFNLSNGQIIHFLLIVLISIASQQTIYSQKFERFSNKEGFNQNTINTITQDSYGFLWFGTPNGLIKYDGYDFNSFANESNDKGSISNNNIKKLFTDSSGILWVGTVEGLDIYVPWLEKFYSVPLSHKVEISQITTDLDGNIFFSGQKELYQCKVVDIENGVFEISDNLLETHSEIEKVNDFFFIDKTTALLATTDGLYHLNLDMSTSTPWPAIKTVTAISFFSKRNITTIQKIQDILWIGTTNGLFKATLEGNKMDIIRELEPISNTAKPSTVSVKTIFEDAEGVVWIGTTAQGLYKYLPKTKDFINYPYDPKNVKGLSSKQIKVVFQDNFKVLWIGTAQGGINKLDLSQKPFKTYSNNPYDNLSIPDNLLNAILEDSQGRLWLAGYNGSLSRSIGTINKNTVNQLQFENLEKEINLGKEDIIRSIFEDDKGFIWIGTGSFLQVYNPSSNTFKKVKLNTKAPIDLDHQYYAILQPDSEHLILGGHQIIVLENPWDKIQKDKYPELEVNSILDLGAKRAQAIIKSGTNKLWVGTQNGLVELVLNYEKKKIETHPVTMNGETINLSNPNIFCLYEDGKGNIWIGTFGGGIVKLYKNQHGNPEKIEYLNKSDGLPDDAIYGMLPEGNKHLWISTDMGLVRFHLDNNKIDIFDVRDGLAQNNFRQGAYFLGKSGYYYFGGLNGLTVFKPEEINLNKQAPNILITDLLVNNQPINIGEKLNNKTVLKKSIAETESITLNQEQRILGFNIAVEHTAMPFKNKVAYKLEGFNENWVEESTGKTTVTYTNLSAGNYRFMVKGANGDGTWSSDVKSLNLKILPPWYQTWWSYLLFALIIIAICTGIVLYFIKIEKLKQQLKYEARNKERLETINQGKFQFFTNLSHEFKTPLTLIAGPLEYIMTNNSDSNNNKYLAIIKKNTKRLLSLADQLITFRQAEQGYLSLSLSKNTLGEFIYPTTEAFENYATDKNINFFYKVNAPNEEIIIDVEKTERIIFNLLSNAFKHTPPHGSISIQSEVKYVDEQKMIHIDVIDSGKGIPHEDLENIFERFYQLGNKKGVVSGGGIGLAFCKTLVNLLGGEITVISTPNVETKFSVILPSKTMKEHGSDTISFSQKSFIKDWVPLTADITDENLNVSVNDSKKKYTILIVENEIDVRTFLSSALSKKYSISLAINGVEALKKIAHQEPDLVVSDVMMPEMDGFELCEKIKADSKTAHISVLLLTALGNNEDLIKGLEFGADEYISKPFSLKHLELRIEKLIQNKAQLKAHFEKNSSLPKKDLEISTRDKEFLENVIGVIEKNIADSNFGVQELSVEMGVSTAQFYRRLKALTGQMPNSYLRNFRLQRAAELLKNNEGYNVTEVMYQIGIVSNSYFSTSFKKLHGVSPSEFMKRNRTSSKKQKGD